MRWQDRRRSDNIEDRRSENSSGVFKAMVGGYEFHYEEKVALLF